MYKVQVHQPFHFTTKQVQSAQTSCDLLTLQLKFGDFCNFSLSPSFIKQIERKTRIERKIKDNSNIAITP